MENTQIKATIIADSITLQGKRITSFELELPRWIWAEMLTHRLFSRNAASSRAVPVKKSVKMTKSDPSQPSMWGSNQSGMQSFTELTGWRLWASKRVWNLAAYTAASFSLMLSKLGLHKQWANRVSEYATPYKVIVTATEFENFFHLRRHEDAQPEIKEVADKMYKALRESIPAVLTEGAWHLPYVVTKSGLTGTSYYINNEKVSLDEARKISCSCCAQVSYRLLNTSLSKALSIYEKLVEAEPVHASPFEHQATPLPMTHSSESMYSTNKTSKDWPDGVTHIDKNGEFWSGNFKGWAQYRQFIPNNVKV